MSVSHAAFERSAARSRLRQRTLITLSSLGEAFPAQLARAVGCDAKRLKAVMYGEPPRYSKAFALCTLGLARERVTPQGRVYTITDAGRRKARQLTARQVRREEVRRQRREARRGVGQVQPHLPPAPPAGAATPGPSSASWSFSL